MNPSHPYLSIVLVARNDNYSGDFNERLANSVHWLAGIAERSALPAELIIVDYNPVAANEPLATTINWPKRTGFMAIRLLHISSESHTRLVDESIRKTVPVFEFIAKNAAIRRAIGEYILCTNADVLFHPDIAAFIAQRKLDKLSYYRAERFDYRKVGQYDFDHLESTLSRIKQNVIRLSLRGYDYKVRYGENVIEKAVSRFRNSVQLFLNHHLSSVPLVASLLGMKTNENSFLLNYHTNASGDFMLMHREHWSSLRGYPEDTIISTHCDSIFTVMAASAGLNERVLPWPVYHQYHERRYNTDIQLVDKSDEIIQMFQRYVRDSRQMVGSGKPLIVNSTEWGLGNEILEETFLTQGR